MLQFKNTIKMQLIGMLEIRLTHKLHLIWICRITLYMTYLITNMPQNDLKSSIHKI